MKCPCFTQVTQGSSATPQILPKRNNRTFLAFVHLTPRTFLLIKNVESHRQRRHRSSSPPVTRPTTSPKHCTPNLSHPTPPPLPSPNRVHSAHMIYYGVPLPILTRELHRRRFHAYGGPDEVSETLQSLDEAGGSDATAVCTVPMRETYRPMEEVSLMRPKSNPWGYIGTQRMELVKELRPRTTYGKTVDTRLLLGECTYKPNPQTCRSELPRDRGKGG